MPWRVGLDEAGYGPNLGPLVMATSACHVPDDAPPSLWKLLRRAVRRTDHKADDRLLIDDSKKVNQGDDGLARLEAGVLATRACRFAPEGGLHVGELLAEVALGHSVSDLQTEPWFNPVDSLPVANEPGAFTAAVERLLEVSSSASVSWGPVRTVLVPAPRFNHLLDEWRNKSGVLATGVIALLGAALELPGEDAIHITVDKLGGRHFYAPLLNEAFPGCWINVLCEGPDCCEYTLTGAPREVHIRFEPRADGEHLNVALASMCAKYLREVCMRQFNRYWLQRVPGIKPTAGYPGDASRFFAEIRNVLQADGVAERAVWRAR
jgi:ribonuclease HII